MKYLYAQTLFDDRKFPVRFSYCCIGNDHQPRKTKGDAADDRNSSWMKRGRQQ